MAENRFKKSVDAATSNTMDNVLDNTIENIPGNIQDNIVYNTKDNILQAVMEREKKNRGSGHTFYLSADVADALNKLAKKTKKSKSTLVNDILRAVFAEEK